MYQLSGTGQACHASSGEYTAASRIDYHGDLVNIDTQILQPEPDETCHLYISDNFSVLTVKPSILV